MQTQSPKTVTGGIVLATLVIGGTLWTSVKLSNSPTPALAQTALSRVYVDTNAPGGDGSSWDQAFASLNDALAYTEALTPGQVPGWPIEIWLAEGSYVPESSGTDPRSATFAINTEVHIFGGFCGIESRRNQRNPEVCPTVLSGDINGDDTTQGSTSNNSYHVLTTGTIGQAVVLDGLTITGGNATNVPPDEIPYGGAILSRCPLIIRNCIIHQNSSLTYGGAVFQESGQLSCSDSVFERNDAASGGAIYLGVGSSGHIEASEFKLNLATGDGGAILAANAEHAYITRNKFYANTADASGGAIALAPNSDTRIFSSVFVGNTAQADGGGIAVLGDSQFQIVNCTLASNEAMGIGGGMHVADLDPALPESDGEITNNLFGYNISSGNSPRAEQLAFFDSDDDALVSANGIYFISSEGPYGAPPNGHGANRKNEPRFVRIPDPRLDGWDGIDDDYGDLSLARDSEYHTNGYGSNDALSTQEISSLDVSGFTRVFCASVSIGAYEFPGTVCHAKVDYHHKVGNLSTGLNLSPAQAFGPGDFLPRQSGPNGGSLPMATHVNGLRQGPQVRPTRPVHRGLMDIITGQPLYQETDFELPFGSAVFRHIRTYGDSVSDQEGNAKIDETAHWDWNGVHWMMGEAPIFLMDGHFRNINFEDSHMPRRCYFIPDAHHAIPFVFDSNAGTDGAYVAPAWMDATLDHNGVLRNGEWELMPTEYYIWLQSGNIKYTVQPKYEHMYAGPPDSNRITHMGACAYAQLYPGLSVIQAACDDDSIRAETNLWAINGYLSIHTMQLGSPYLGLVTEIQDRNGNSIEYSYCDYSGNSCANQDGSSCEEHFCHECSRFGQIDTIRLRAAPSATSTQGNVVWTLAYTYRNYSDNDGTWSDAFFNTLHSIHVYEGDVNLEPNCRVIDYSEFEHCTDVTCVDSVTAMLPQNGNLPDNWSIEARYTYADPALKAIVGYWWDIIGFIGDRPYLGLLLKSTVRTRTHGADAESQSVNEVNTMYRYTRQGGNQLLTNEVVLTRVFDNETIESISQAEKVGDPSWSSNELFSVRDIDVVEFLDPSRPDCAPCVGDSGTNPVCDVGGSCEDTVDSLPLGLLADVTMALKDGNGDAALSAGYADGLAMFAGLDIGGDMVVIGRRPGRSGLVDRRSQQARAGVFRYFHLFYLDSTQDFFLPYIDEQIDLAGNGERVAEDPGLYHYPFKHFSGSAGWLSNRPDQPFWITFIDEIDDEAGDAYDPISVTGIRSRRVVEMNAPGFVLRDRTWEFVDGTAELVSQTGSGTTVKYDCAGRPIEIRSTGWGSVTTTAGQASDGLIQVLEYEDDLCNWNAANDACDCLEVPDIPEEDDVGELVRIGVKRGTEGAVHYTQRFERHRVRPDLITKQYVFPEPVTDPMSTDGDLTTTDYTLDECSAGSPGECIPESSPVREQLTVGPGAPITDGGPPVYRSERMVYDEGGNLVEHGVGLVGSSKGADPIEYHYMINEYDDKGRKIRETVDADLPPYTHHPPGEAPLNLVTTYEYDSVFGLTSTTYPDGREERIEFVEVDDGLEQWVYRDVETDGGTFSVNAPVQVTRFEGGRVVWTKQVKLTTPTEPPHASTDLNTYDEIITATPTYNTDGRVSGLGWSQGSTSNPNDFDLQSKISYNYFGEIARIEEPDGTITRNIYDERGRLLRVYRGTKDQHFVWGTAPPDDDDAINDNLILSEKRYYGSGVTDSELLTEVRTYRSSVADQYFLTVCPDDCPGPDCPSECDPIPAQNNEDLVGLVEKHQYDWRMRDVWVQQNDAGGNPISHSLTWYDNIDRVRFMAEYGTTAPAPGSVGDPRSLNSTSTLPTAADIIADNRQPDYLLALTENVYNARGQVEEVRVYNVETGTPLAGTYTSTKRYYNQGDQPLEVITPNAPEQRFKYDGKNRQFENSSWADDGTEITRTQTVYDTDDRVTQTVRWERKERSEGALNDTNSVKTYSFSWYDSSGRLIATADFGTNNADFSTGPAPAYDATEAPALFSGDNLVSCQGNGYVGEVRTTCYQYDEAERITKVIHPDGTASTSEYDHLGRLVLKTENADGDPKNITAYQYDDRGRLSKIAAVLPDHGTVTSVDQVDFNANDGTIQVTELRYGADVVAEDDPSQILSGHEGWVSRVIFPDPDNDQHTTNAMDRTLAFTYYTDGSVATRQDARGYRFTYDYDDLSRLAGVSVMEDAVLQNGQERWYNSDTTDPPTDRIDEIGYEYASDGMLDRVTARSEGDVIAQNEFRYDTFNNLTAEFQAHGALVDGSTPSVSYAWEFSPQDQGNYNRLLSMTYPYRDDYATQRTVSFDYGYGAGTPGETLNRISQITDSQIGTVASYEYAGTGRRVRTGLGNGVMQEVAGGSGYSRLDRFGRITDLMFRSSTGVKQRFEYGYDKAGNRIYTNATQLTADGTALFDDRSWLYGYDDLNRLISAEIGKLNTSNLTIAPSGTVPSRLWTLDNLGNWSGTESLPGLQFSGSTTDAVTHEVDFANQITRVSESTGDRTDFVYDTVGNLVDDGEYIYQYDAWNRLIQVNAHGEIPPTYVDDGSGRPIKNAVIGPVIAHYHYDGLGRLIRDDVDPDRPIDYYYDGVRRIQEVKIENGRPRAREYIYGPDYVDELVCRIDEDNAVHYFAQDANYNVVALFDTLGEVVAQFTWNPYGTLVASETYAPHADVRIGHQGLFFTRYDGTSSDPTLAPDTAGLYNNRNRHYNPTLGRFMQRDPNETAAVLLESLAMKAQQLSIMVNAFDAKQHYMDGMNTYAYGGGNPFHRDPLGLDWYDDEIDNLTAEITGHRLYSLGTINEGAKWASIGLNTALGIAGSLLPGAGLYDAFNSVKVIASGKGGFWDAVNIATAALPGVAAARKVLGLRSLFKARGFRARSLVNKCNCFVAGTPIETPNGTVPIEAINEGDVVLTRPERQPFSKPRATRVTRVFKNVAPAILWLTFANGTVLGTTPGHEVWTKETGWTHADELQVGQRFVDDDGHLVAITAKTLDPTPTVVYNLEVEGTYTYFVDGLWVHNNSCRGVRNAKLAGKKHGKSGVPFDDDGFPDFSEWAIDDIVITPTGNPASDIAAANRISPAPPGYTWHHHQDYGRMQLVPSGLHQLTGHTGGAAIWGGGWK